MYNRNIYDLSINGTKQDQTSTLEHNITSPYFTINDAAAPANGINIGNSTNTQVLAIDGLQISMGNASATSTMALSSVDQSQLSSNLYQTSSIQQVISTPSLKLNSTNTSANTVAIRSSTTTSITITLGNKPISTGYTIYILH